MASTKKVYYHSSENWMATRTIHWTYIWKMLVCTLEVLPRRHFGQSDSSIFFSGYSKRPWLVSQKIHAGSPQSGHDKGRLDIPGRGNLPGIYNHYNQWNEATTYLDRELIGGITTGKLAMRTISRLERLTKLCWGCPFYNQPAINSKILPIRSKNVL